MEKRLECQSARTFALPNLGRQTSRQTDRRTRRKKAPPAKTYRVARALFSRGRLISEASLPVFQRGWGRIFRMFCLASAQALCEWYPVNGYMVSILLCYRDILGIGCPTDPRLHLALPRALHQNSPRYQYGFSRLASWCGEPARVLAEMRVVLNINYNFYS